MPGFPVMVQRKRIRLGTMRLPTWSLVLLIGLSIWHCCVLWCRSQTQLRSYIALAVAKAFSCSSDLIPSLRTSICSGCGPKKQKQTNKQTNKKKTKADPRGWSFFVIWLLDSPVLHPIYTQLPWLYWVLDRHKVVDEQVKFETCRNAIEQPGFLLLWLVSWF